LDRHDFSHNHSKIQQKIICAAVQLIENRGYHSVFVKDITQSAGITKTEFYRHFSSKRTVCLAYYHVLLRKSIDTVDTLDGFCDYTFQEQLQAFYEILLDGYTDEKIFIKKSFSQVFLACCRESGSETTCREIFMGPVDDAFHTAITSGKIPDPMFRETAYDLLWKFYIAMVIYWLNDTSEHNAQTSVLIDKFLDLYCSFLAAGISNKAFDLGSFLAKNFLMGCADSFQWLNTEWKEVWEEKLRQYKRVITGQKNE